MLLKGTLKASEIELYVLVTGTVKASERVIYAGDRHN